MRNVIGGLIQDRDQETISKVPFLGDIPLLGWLFKTKNITRSKTNLLILLTPKIVKDARDLAELSEKQKLKFTEASDKTGPLEIPAAINPPPAAKPN